MDGLGEVVSLLGGMGVIGAVLGYVGKQAVEAYFRSRVVIQQSELAVGLEAHKADLLRVNSEHSVRFNHLHAERAEAIKNLYSRLALLDDLIRSTLRPFQAVVEEPLQKKVIRIAADFNALREYLLPRRIFLEPQVCELIDAALELAKDIFHDITTYEVDPRDEPNREVLKERRELWEKARAVFAEQFGQVMRELEKEFRSILGIAA